MEHTLDITAAIRLIEAELAAEQRRIASARASVVGAVDRMVAQAHAGRANDGGRRARQLDRGVPLATISASAIPAEVRSRVRAQRAHDARVARGLDHDATEQYRAETWGHGRTITRYTTIASTFGRASSPATHYDPCDPAESGGATTRKPLERLGALAHGGAPCIAVRGGRTIRLRLNARMRRTFKRLLPLAAANKASNAQLLELLGTLTELAKRQ